MDNLIFICLFIIAGAIAIPMAIKANKRQRLENEQIARDLNWNLHTGWYGSLGTAFPIDRNYFFFKNHLGANGLSYYFDGKYKNYDFVLTPITISQGDYGQLNYLAAELKNLSLKNYDFVILSKAENNLVYTRWAMGKYKKVKLESHEFNKEFVVYAEQAQDVFYHLPPDRMFKLLGAKDFSTINKLFVQVKQNSILVCGDYRSYIDFVNGRNEASKEEILLGFMDTVLTISKTIVNML